MFINQHSKKNKMKMGTKFKLQIQFVNEINLHHLNKIETQKYT